MSGTEWTAGQRANALQFDGTNDYVSIPDSSSLDITSSITISTWIRPTDVSGSRVFLSKHSSPSDTGYLLASINGILFFQFGDGGGWPYSSSTSLSAVSANTWQHVAVTRSGGTVNFYINGVLDVTRSVGTNNIAINNQHVWLGGDVNIPGHAP
jgi:hypothetical protein